MLEHIFLSSTSCFDWYQKHGNVVVFDTIYKINFYEMSFEIFVGMNSHRKTILFEFTLLLNQTMFVFRWLIKRVIVISINLII